MHIAITQPSRKPPFVRPIIAVRGGISKQRWPGDEPLRGSEKREDAPRIYGDCDDRYV